MTLENIFYAKSCLRCDESVPVSEKKCYCDGPLILKKFSIEKKDVVNNYGYRKMLYLIRSGGNVK